MMVIGSIDLSSEIALYESFKDKYFMAEGALKNYFLFDDNNHILWILWTQDDGREYNFAYRAS